MEWEPGVGATKDDTWRGAISTAIIWIIVLGWIFLAVDGALTVHYLWADSSGETAWSYWRLSMGAAGREVFQQLWNDPLQRQAYLNQFTLGFWESRFLFYGIPTVVLGMIGLLIKPK